MDKKESTYINNGGSGFNTPGNIIAIGLFILLLGSGFIIWSMSSNNFQLKKLSSNQKNQIDSLELSNQLFLKRVDSLNDQTVALEKEAEELMKQRDMYQSSRDSVARLLAYSRANEKNSQGKIAKLQKQLKELQAKLDSIERKYNELLASSGDSSVELERRIKALTDERNALSQENQDLRKDLDAATGNADNRTALFVVGGMSVTPGEIKNKKFSPSERSQNTDRLEVRFRLSRAPKPTETLILKVFDATNKELSLKPNYRNELNAPANPTDQRVMLEFAGGKLERKASGKYSVRVYLTDVNKGLENQEVGTKEFSLK